MESHQYSIATLAQRDLQRLASALGKNNNCGFSPIKYSEIGGIKKRSDTPVQEPTSVSSVHARIPADRDHADLTA